jgi:hypothetical protein
MLLGMRKSGTSSNKLLRWANKAEKRRMWVSKSGWQTRCSEWPAETQTRANNGQVRHFGRGERVSLGFLYSAWDEDEIVAELVDMECQC